MDLKEQVASGGIGRLAVEEKSRVQKFVVARSAHMRNMCLMHYGEGDFRLVEILEENLESLRNNSGWPIRGIRRKHSGVTGS